MIPAILEALSDGCSDCAVTLRRGKGKVHCPLHSDDTGSLDVQEGDNGTPLLFCHQCGDSDGIIANLRDRGLWAKPTMRVINGGATSAKKAVNVYEYTDRTGRLLYREVRYEPKDFRLQRADGTWSLDGVQRVLYRLPEVVAAVTERKRIWIPEGAKDADAIADLGLVATTNVGGAGKFLEEYAADLVGADVVLIADKDEPGRAHVKDAAQKLSVAARSIRILEMPGKAKDVSDWLAAGGTREVLETFADMAEEWTTGERIIWTPKDSAADYRDVLQRRIDGDPEYVGWPTGFRSLDKEMRYVAGDYWMVMAATSVGKSAFMQSLQRRCTVPSVYFTAEMTRTQLIDRLISAEAQVDAWKVSRGTVDADERQRILAELDRFERSDMHIVDISSLTTKTIESVLRIARVRFGIRVVYLDYIGLLIDRDGGTRYEQMTNISHDLQRISKTVGVCLIGASQVNRKGDRKSGEPPYMEEMRDSGVIEEDASVVLGIGRAEGATDAKLAIRKNRHGLQGFTLPLKFDAIHTEFMEPSEARLLDRTQPREREVGPVDAIPF